MMRPQAVVDGGSVAMAFNSLTVVKRDGRLVAFSEEKIRAALQRAGEATCGYDEEVATRLAAEVTGRLLGRAGGAGDTAGVEQIQDEVERVLLRAGQLETARAYIAYREKRRALRADRRTVIEVESSVNEYLTRADWRVNANANQGYSLGGLILNISGKVIANYWLSHVYPPEVGAPRRLRADTRGSASSWRGAPQR